jgi:hypothetical protein
MKTVTVGKKTFNAYMHCWSCEHEWERRANYVEVRSNESQCPHCKGTDVAERWKVVVAQHGV